MQNYTIEVPQLGKGAFGDISLARKKSRTSCCERFGKDRQEKVVLKRIMSGPVHNEIRAGRTLRHPNIVKLVDQFYHQGCIYLAFEYMEGSCDLFDLMERRDFLEFDEEDARKIVYQVAKALQYCHARGVAHKDVKLENIVVEPDTKQATLIDFGLCEFAEDGPFSRCFCGSLPYTSPELRNLTLPYCPFKADVWSCGVVLYVLLTSILPFDCDKEDETFELTFPDFVTLSQEVMDLLAGMLDPNSDTRLSIDQVLEHPFFTSSGCSPVLSKPHLDVKRVSSLEDDLDMMMQQLAIVT